MNNDLYGACYFESLNMCLAGSAEHFHKQNFTFSYLVLLYVISIQLLLSPQTPPDTQIANLAQFIHVTYLNSSLTVLWPNESFNSMLNS